MSVDFRTAQLQMFIKQTVKIRNFIFKIFLNAKKMLFSINYYWTNEQFISYFYIIP